ncbi:hypothetical protein ACC771_22850, partial [Rhizobium ruizarguesonis]
KSRRCRCRTAHFVVYDTAKQEIVKRIELAGALMTAAPNPVALTEDGTRAYVALATGGVAVIDTVGLHEVDLNPSTAAIDRLT